MTRKLFVTWILWTVYTLAFAGGTERRLCITKDSVVRLCVKNYQKITFYDTNGIMHTGKIFMPNDSQFYFLNYFKERKSKIYHLRDIYSIDNLVKIKTETNPNAKRQKTHLSSNQVVIIVLLTSGFAAPILLIRELFLYAEYGPGHAHEYYLYKQTLRLKNVYATIVNSTPN